jgi:TolB-like protein/Flp pilus assembly protein TadD
MPAAEDSSEAVRDQLERILSSAGFVHNERLSRFLRYVVEQRLSGKAAGVKESLVAVEVFGRRPDYNPRRDAVVRAEAARLRARLAEYYDGPGTRDSLVIKLPKGGYVPEFHRPKESYPLRESRSRRLGPVIALACLVIILAAAGTWRLQHKSAPITIAVLPLENLNHDPTGDYLADGLTVELIRNLAIIDGLAPRSRTSSFGFRSKPQDARETGKQLGADYLLEGSVLRAGDRLRINVQLFRARDNFPIWAGKFDRELTDVFAIQDEISRGIVNTLRLKLGGGRRRYETSVEAYDLYLQARALPIQRGFWGFVESIGPFEQAIAKDPSFAPAYAGLAAAYATSSSGFEPADRIAGELAQMRAAAEKAIQLDPLLAEAHDAMGLAYSREGQWEQSERSFRRAIKLDPGRALTYCNFAVVLLLPLGRNREALNQMHMAEIFDPLAPEVRFDLAHALLMAGRYDESAAECRKLPPDYAARIYCLGRASLAQDRTAEAIHVLSAGDANRGKNLAELGHAYARAGRRNEAEKLTADLAPNPFQQALIFAGLGDKERTLEAVERMRPLGAWRIGLALNSPEFALLRGDFRVKILRKKVGLPQ